MERHDQFGERFGRVGGGSGGDSRVFLFGWSVVPGQCGVPLDDGWDVPTGGREGSGRIDGRRRNRTESGNTNG